MDTKLNTTFYQYLYKYNEIIKLYQLNQSNLDNIHNIGGLSNYRINLRNNLIYENTSDSFGLNDIEGYKNKIYNVIVFLQKYPDVLKILPDEIMTSRKIKFFLISSYNELFFDKDVFLNVWMDYFKWKLTYSDLNDPPCR